MANSMLHTVRIVLWTLVVVAAAGAGVLWYSTQMRPGPSTQLAAAPEGRNGGASAASAALAAVAGHSGTGFHECQYRQPSERHPSPPRQGCWAYDARRISH